MPAARIGRGPALALSLVAALLQVLPAAPPAAATSPSEETMHGWVNDQRRERGIERLELNERISQMARNHSERMAERGEVYHHECLECRFDRWDWHYLGENVGAMDTMRDVFRAFMESAGHRQNILDRDFWQEGVGIVRDRGRVWVTIIFYG